MRSSQGEGAETTGELGYSRIAHAGYPLRRIAALSAAGGSAVLCYCSGCLMTLYLSRADVEGHVTAPWAGARCVGRTHNPSIGARGEGRRLKELTYTRVSRVHL